ncbi:hypothetical protein NMY22_g17169 [Coprinellus aureogranulatus]|nr:hypothetical protein NMY22_g17169 [Coprinellus aureogranulatus]
MNTRRGKDSPHDHPDSPFYGHTVSQSGDGNDAPRFAYVTLLTCNSYLPGVLVLWFSLQEVESKYPLIVMTTRSLPNESRGILRKAGIALRTVEELNHTFENQLDASDSRLTDAWTKLRGFELVEFNRIVLLDCDMIVRRNMDELFTLPLPLNQIAAVHVCACNPYQSKHYPQDWTPENCAHSKVSTPTSHPPNAADIPRPYGLPNSGMLVFQPSHQLFETVCRPLGDEGIVKAAAFADQDIIAAAFHGKWVALPWYYNALRTLPRTHPELWDDAEVRCVHYMLQGKPWQSRTRALHLEYTRTHKWWWQTFDRMYPSLEENDPEGALWLLTQVDFDAGAGQPIATALDFIFRLLSSFTKRLFYWI